MPEAVGDVLVEVGVARIPIRNRRKEIVAHAGKWRAHGRVDGVLHHLGCFDNENDANTAAVEWRLKHMPFTNEARA